MRTSHLVVHLRPLISFPFAQRRGTHQSFWLASRPAYHQRLSQFDRLACASALRISSAKVRHGRSIVLLPRGSYGAHDVTWTPHESHMVLFSPAMRLGALSPCKCVIAHRLTLRIHVRYRFVHLAVSAPLLVFFK